MKKTRTRIGSILLALVLVLTLLPVSALAVTEIVTDENTLKTAVAQGGDIQLGENFSLVEGLVIPTGVSVTIDLNGKTLSNTTASTLITVSSGASLTIQDTGSSGKIVSEGTVVQVEASGTIAVQGGTLETTGSYSSALSLSNSQEDNTITGGTIQAVGPVISVSGSKLTIGKNGGANDEITIESTGEATCGMTIANASNVTIQSGTFISENKSTTFSLFDASAFFDRPYITITGGSFSSECTGENAIIRSDAAFYFQVSGGTFSILVPKTSIAAGHALVSAGPNGGYIVRPLSEVLVQLTYAGEAEPVNYTSAEAALNAAKDKTDAQVTVVADVATEQALTVPAGVTLTVNSGKELSCGAITISEGAKLENNGTITAKNSVTNNGTVSNEGTLTAGSISAVSGTWTNQSAVTLTGNSNVVSKVDPSNFTGGFLQGASDAEHVTVSVIGSGAVSGLNPGKYQWNGSAFEQVRTTITVTDTSGNSLYETDSLEDALQIANSTSGATVTLLESIHNSRTLPAMASNVTLDLGGYTLTTQYPLTIDSGVTATVKNGSLSFAATQGSALDVEGKLTAESLAISTGSRSSAYGVTVVGGQFTLDDESSIFTYEVGILVLGDNAKVDVYGSVTTQSPDGKDTAIQGNGRETTNSAIKIYPGAIIKADGMGIYHPQSGTLTVDGATVTGSTAIGIKGGELVVMGNSTITGTGEAGSYTESVGGGIASNGEAICVQGNYAGEVSVDVQAGELTGGNGIAVGVYDVTSSGAKNVTFGSGVVVKGNVVTASPSSDSGKMTIKSGAQITGKVMAASGGVVDSSQNETITVEVTDQAGKPFTVTFNAGEGTCMEESRTVIYGYEIGTLPSASRTGYTFLGWYIGNTRVSSSYTVTGNVTLVAQWQLIPSTPSAPSISDKDDDDNGYSVSVPASSSIRGGSISVSPRSAEKGDTVTITVKPDDGYVLDELTVTARNGGEVDLTRKNSSQYTFKMPAGSVVIEVSFIKEEDAPTAEMSFGDVPESYWAYSEIQWAYENGYMNGTSATTFNPTGTVTRQQVWMILARMSGANPANMAAAKTWAEENGISDGTNPGGAVTRQQLVSLLYRFAGQMGYDTNAKADLSSYPDVGAVASYATDAMAWAVANSIVGGTTQGTLNPAGTANRAQFAVILWRFYQTSAN